MVKTVNIFDTNVLIFLFTFIFFSLLLVLYNLFKPEDEIGYNFQPYPEFSPKNIPDVGSGSCYSKLTECINGQCPNCSDDYECVVSETDGQYVFNNQSTVAGKSYCLPKKKNNSQCNRYSGQWTWVNDPDFCGSDGTQCWKCICKYPNIFSNSDKVSDCTVKVGCSIPNSKNIDAVGNKNNLVSTKALEDDSNGTIKQGTIWDPNSNNTDVLQYNVYGKDKNGNPYFICDCSGYNSTNYYPLINLPGDPYKCHFNKCDKGHTVKPTLLSNGEIDCDCIGQGLGKIGANSTKKNRCILQSDVCNEINAGNDEPIVDGNNVIIDCNCKNIGSYSQQCISNHANKDRTPCADEFSSDKTLPSCTTCKDGNMGCLPKCSNVHNKIGIECRSKSILLKCGDHGRIQCNGTGADQTCFCQCQAGYTGTTCDTKCLVGGTDVSYSYDTGGCSMGGCSHGTTYDLDKGLAAQCCSGKYKSVPVSGMYEYGSKYYCT